MLAAFGSTEPMTSLIAGLDWSSSQLDLCLLPLDPSDKSSRGWPRWRTVELPGRAHERLRNTRDVVRDLMKDVHDIYDAAAMGTGWSEVHEIVNIWIEEPWGAFRNTDRALLPIYGALVAAVPDRIVVSSFSAKEWRPVLGLPGGTRGKKYDKQWSIDKAREFHDVEMTEHQAEALLIALAGRELTWRYADAAS